METKMQNKINLALDMIANTAFADYAADVEKEKVKFISRHQALRLISEFTTDLLGGNLDVGKFADFLVARTIYKALSFDPYHPEYEGLPYIKKKDVKMIIAISDMLTAAVIDDFLREFDTQPNYTGYGTAELQFIGHIIKSMSDADLKLLHRRLSQNVLDAT